MIHSEIIVKRIHNTIRIAMIIYPKMSSTKILFLIGYTEELLSNWLKCMVKLELQVIKHPDEVVFTHV